jgi:hypothetical protein
MSEVFLHQLGLTAAEALIELAEHAALGGFPVHPRTHEHLRAFDLLGRLERSRVHVAHPLGYLDFVGLEAEAETSALGVPWERVSEIPGLLERPQRAEPIPLWHGEAGARSAHVVATFLEAITDDVVDVWH